jgi:hypothetical protein
LSLKLRRPDNDLERVVCPQCGFDGEFVCMRQRRIENFQSLLTSFQRFRVRRLRVGLERRRGSQFSVEGKSVVGEFEDPLHPRLRQRACFSLFEFKVEVLLRGRFVSQSVATLAKALETLGKLLPPGRRFWRWRRGRCRCRVLAKIGPESKFEII